MISTVNCMSSQGVLLNFSLSEEGNKRYWCASPSTLANPSLQRSDLSSEVSRVLMYPFALGIHLFDDIVSPFYALRQFISKRPLHSASHFQVLPGGTNKDMSIQTGCVIPNPTCATIDVSEASICIWSGPSWHDDNIQWLFLVEKMQRPFDRLRPGAEEKREVFSQERLYDHETSADYGEVGFDDSKGGRDDDGASQIISMKEAGDEVDAERTNDACSVLWTLGS